MGKSLEGHSSKTMSSEEKNVAFKELPEQTKLVLASLFSQEGKPRGKHPYDYLDDVMVKATKRPEPTAPGDYW